jgi:hypothetical protein
MGAAGQRLMQDGFDKRRQFDAFLAHFADVAVAAARPRAAPVADSSE